jgi:glutamine amidotransferase
MIVMAKPLGRSVKVGVLDYGAGNFLSVVRALQALGADPVRIAQDERHGAEALSHLIFPGVGRASQAMAALRSQGPSTR